MGALLFPSNRSLSWSQILEKKWFFVFLTMFPLGEDDLCGMSGIILAHIAT